MTAQEEHELSFIGRRIRGEIFFARRWILIEGQSEYVLLHAIGRALDYPLDRHGAAVIDFQNNGDADIYPALATSFGIPCLRLDQQIKDEWRSTYIYAVLAEEWMARV